MGHVRNSATQQFSAWLVHQVGAMLKQAVAVLVMGVGMYWTGQDVLSGTLAAGDFVAIAAYVVQVFLRIFAHIQYELCCHVLVDVDVSSLKVYRPLASLDRELKEVTDAIADLQGLCDLLATTPRIMDPPKPKALVAVTPSPVRTSSGSCGGSAGDGTFGALRPVPALGFTSNVRADAWIFYVRRRCGRDCGLSPLLDNESLLVCQVEHLAAFEVPRVQWNGVADSSAPALIFDHVSFKYPPRAESVGGKNPECKGSWIVLETARPIACSIACAQSVGLC
jgi:ABC-type multidrug transport system fused ATPase/permease subunit